MKSLGLFKLVFPLLVAPAVAATGDSRLLQFLDDSNCTSIIETICEGEYSTDTLCDFLDIAGIGDELENGTWTVFAPTDDAFDSVPIDYVNMLVGGNDTFLLMNLLAFHTVDGEALMSSDLRCDGRVSMANEELTVTRCEGDRVYQIGLGNPITDYPEITFVDIETCNGVVHLINKVMLPEPIVTPTGSPTVTASAVPSDGPSLEPSLFPSDGPSLEPSVVPTGSPSLRPSDGPSLEPSVVPTSSPSLRPSDGPSLEPSLFPSDGPSLEPSVTPTNSASHLPSDGPSLEPSITPTESPSDEPSPKATSVPTIAPTSSPTPIPTAVPTKQPTACSIYDIACNSADFNYLCAALTTTGLDFFLGDYNRTFTVFAPNDAAFEKLGDATIAYLLDDDSNDLLTNILAFHVVDDGLVFSGDLECSETIEMVNGKDTRTVCKNDSVFQKGKGNSDDERPEIIGADIETCNGIIHAIDGVMLYDFPDDLGFPSDDSSQEIPATGSSQEIPATDSPQEVPVTDSPQETTAMTPPPTVEKIQPVRVVPDDVPSSCKTVSEVVCDDPNFSILCSNLESTGISEALTGGNWTLFAPNNEAFLKLPPAYVQRLTADSGVEMLSRLMLFHAVQDKELYLDDLPCVAGQNLIEMANGKDSRTLCKNISPRVPVPRYQKGKYNTDDKLPAFVRTDMEACNGVIHELDGVLLYSRPRRSIDEQNRKKSVP